MAGPNPTLSLHVRAPEAILEFERLTSAAASLRAELVALGGGTGGASELVRLKAQVNELTAGLKASQTAMEQMQAQMKASSVEAQRQVQAESAVVKEAARQKELSQKRDIELYKEKGAAAKKAAQDEAEGISYIQRVQNQSALMTGTASLRMFDAQQRAEQARQAAVYFAEQRELARTAGIQQNRDVELLRNAQKDNAARISQEQNRDVITYTMRENEIRRVSLIDQNREFQLYKAEQREMARLDGLAQQRQTAEFFAAQKEAQRIALLEQEQQYKLYLIRQKELSAAATATEAASGARARELGGAGRSAARGAAAAGGGLFLSYGQNIPALAAAFGTGMAVKESIQGGAEFEKTMAFVQIAADDAKVSIKDLSAEILKMASSGSMFGPKELADGLRKLVEAGIPAKEAMQALIPVMNLAKLGQMDIGQASRVAQQLMHSFNLEATDMQKIGDVMVKAANISATDVTQMGNAMKQASTIARQFNVSIEQTGAILGVLAKQGIVGQAAGTAMRNMFMELDPHTTKARLAFEQIGVKVYDSNKQFRSITEILKDMAGVLATKNPQAVNQFLQDAFNERGLKAAYAGLVEISKDLPLFISQLNQASKGAGYMAESMKILGATASASWDRFKSTLESSLIQGFKSSEFVPTMERLTAAVSDPKFIGGVSALVTGFGKLLTLVVDLLGPLGTVVSGWQSLAGVVDTASSSVKSFVESTDSSVAKSALTSAMGGISNLSSAGGVFGFLLFGGWGQGAFQTRLEMLRGAVSDFLEFVNRGTTNASRILEIDDQVDTLKGRIKTNATRGIDTTVDQAQVNRLLAERLTLLQAMNAERNKAPRALTADEASQNARELARQGTTSLTPGVDVNAPTPAQIGSGTGDYVRIKAELEAAKRARIDQLLAINKIQRDEAEATNKFELQLLDAKHRYGLITEEDYTERVDKLQDERIKWAEQAADKEAADVRGRIAGLLIESARIAERTKLLQAEARLRAVMAEAENIKDQRATRVEGERTRAERDRSAAVAAFKADLDKINESLELQRDKAKQAIESPLMAPGARAAAEAVLQVRSAYASLEAKYRREIAELEAKGTEESQRKADALKPVLALLEQTRGVQEAIGAAEAKSNRERQREFTYGWRAAYQQYVDDAGNSAQQARDLFNSSTKAMEDAIVKFSQTGKFSFRDLANVIIQEMIRIQAKKAALGLVEFFGGIFKMGISAFAGAVGPTGANMDAGITPVNVGHTGGIVGVSALSSRSISPLYFANAPRFHGGGIVGDERPIIAKKNEGIFTPEQMAHLAPASENNGVLIGSINIYSDGSTDIEANGAKQAALARRIAEVTRAVIQQEQKPGGLIARVK